MERAVGLVSWGRKGTVRFAQMSAQLLSQRGIDFGLSISSASELRSEFVSSYPFTIIANVPRVRARMLASPLLARQAAQRTVENFKSRSIDRIVVLVPHPWDFALAREARKSGMEFAQVIHDARSHPGDLWPSPSAIHRRVRSADEIICLSQYVADLLTPIANSIRVAPHPALPPEVPAQKRPQANRYALFVGRFRRYKGLDLLLDAWPHVSTPGVSLRIMGEGPFPDRPLPVGVELTNRWLSDAEMAAEVARASVVVLPYLEASQSGVIPLALSLGVPVVATPVGGLSEQFVDGETGLISEGMDPRSFASSVDVALGREWSHVRPRADNDRFADALLGL